MWESSMVLAVDIGGTYIRTGIIDIEFTIRSFEKQRTVEVIGTKSKKEALKNLADYLHDVMIQSGVREKINHVCLGVPSIIAKDKDYVLSTPNVPALQDIALKSELERNLGLSVSVENDVNLSTLGEYTLLDQRKYPNVVGIYIGTGIGCGLILNQRLFTGASNLAAEFGHIPTRLTEKHRQCNCGLYDCLEVWASGSFFDREMKKAGRDNEIPSIFVDYSSDMLKTHIVDIFFKYLAFGLYTVNTLLNPNMFIFSGGVVEMEGFPKEKLLDLPYGRLRHESVANSLETKFGVLGEKAFIHGALEYYMHYT